MTLMRAAVQRALLATYETANRLGVLDARIAESVFQRCYFAYKYLIEDSFAGLVKARPELFAGGEVIDVGANIGYTAQLFARAVAAPHRVHAFEPEQRNFRWLGRAIERANLGDRIVAHHMAVGSQDGMVDLWNNTGHHADHRIATDRLRASVDGPTQRVPITTIDSYVARSGGPPVSFVKIDVQGFEAEVVRGMHETIAANPGLHVALELTPLAFDQLGFDVQAFMRDLGRTFSRAAILERSGRLRAASLDEILAIATRSQLGYVDLVCSRR
jgi:FkbM family methyltransferase